MERGVKKITVRKNRTIIDKGDLRMKKINEDDFLMKNIIKKINDFLIKNSFKENIKTEKKVIMTPDGSVCMVHERYFIIDNCNETIYLDTLNDVLNYILETIKKEN